MHHWANITSGYWATTSYVLVKKVLNPIFPTIAKLRQVNAYVFSLQSDKYTRVQIYTCSILWQTIVYVRRIVSVQLEFHTARHFKYHFLELMELCMEFCRAMHFFRSPLNNIAFLVQSFRHVLADPCASVCVCFHQQKKPDRTVSKSAFLRAHHIDLKFFLHSKNFAHKMCASLNPNSESDDTNGKKETNNYKTNETSAICKVQFTRKSDSEI